jgi:hypothetical protein
LNERCRLLHERTGAALESIHAETLDDHVAELAYHYSRNDNAGKASEHCYARETPSSASTNQSLSSFVASVMRFVRRTVRRRQLHGRKPKTQDKAQLPTTFTMAVDPGIRSPVIGSKRPPRYFAMNFSSRAVKSSRFSGRKNP